MIGPSKNASQNDGTTNQTQGSKDLAANKQNSQIGAKPGIPGGPNRIPD